MICFHPIQLIIDSGGLDSQQSGETLNAAILLTFELYYL